MQLEKIEMSAIKPDPNNPRDDFGDLDALAASFELNALNPGEPINPPIVVRDGSICRIVDGERRYRAMTQAGREVCNVIVCEDMDEANAMVAMLATDDKRPLSDAERSRGIQQMLLLGVDDAVVERAGRLEAGRAKRIRRGAKSAGDAAQQMDIDQLIAIGEAEERGDGEAAKAITEAKYWRSEEREWIDFRNTQSQRTIFDDVCAAAGVDILSKKPKSSVYESGLWGFFDPERVTREDMEKWVGKASSQGWAVVLGEVVKGRYGYGPEAFSIPPGLTEEEAAANSSFNKAKSAMTRAKKRRAQWAAERLADPSELEHTIAFFATPAMLDSYDTYHFCDRAGIEREDVPASSCAYMVAEHWERADGMTQDQLRALIENNRARTHLTQTGFVELAREFNDFLGALIGDGYMPDEPELELSDACWAIIKSADDAEKADRADGE